MNPGPVLAWLVPPVLGAAAGWLIGRIAFPLFTAGSLRRKAPAIADAAADRSKEIASWLLSMPIAGAPQPGEPGEAPLAEQVLADLASGILSSRETIYAIRDLVSNAVHHVASRPVAEIAKELSVQSLVADRLLPAVSDERRRKALAGEAGALVGRKAGVAINDEVVGELSRVVESAMPAASDALVRWLDSPETRRELSARGRELLPKILEKLSDLQKLFVTAGQFDRRLDEKMPEIVDETVRTLEAMARDPRQQERLVTVFSDAARGWRDSLLVTPIGPPARDSARDRLARASAEVLERLIGTLADADQREQIAAAAAGSLEKDRRTVGAFARDVFKVREEDVAETVSTRLLAFLTRPETARELARRLLGLVRRPGVLPGAPPAQPGAATVREALHIDEIRGARVERSLRSALPSLVTRLVPPVARSVARSPAAGRLLGLLGAAAGLGAGLVVIAMKAIGVP